MQHYLYERLSRLDAEHLDPTGVNHTLYCFFARPLLCASDFVFLLLVRTVVSQPYNAPAPNTSVAPTIINPLNLLPNSQTLSMKLTSFLMLSTMVTVTADEHAPRRLTPVMHASCVNEFMAR